MEEIERYEVMSPSLNGYAYIHDFKTDNVLNTYDSCDLLNQQSKRIKELEKENRDLEDDHNKLIDQYDKQYNDLCKEIQFNSSVRERFVKKVKELKQQLAEKEKQLENAQNLKAIEVADELSLKLSKIHNQDKISFAVEQLEQLKKLCQEKFNWWENSEWEGDIYDKSDVSNAYFDIEANVDNQIEELKKEMK